MNQSGFEFTNNGMTFRRKERERERERETERQRDRESERKSTIKKKTNYASLNILYW